MSNINRTPMEIVAIRASRLENQMLANPKKHMESLKSSNADWDTLLAASAVLLKGFLDGRMKGAAFTWLPKLYLQDDDALAKLSAIGKVVSPLADFRMGNIPPLCTHNASPLTTFNKGSLALMGYLEVGEVPQRLVIVPNAVDPEEYPALYEQFGEGITNGSVYRPLDDQSLNPRFRFVVTPTA